MEIKKEMKKMKIDIWSDIACPYCYIGKRKLEMALAKFPHADEVELVWYSYELNPALPKLALGRSIYQYMAEQHGKSENFERENCAKIAAVAKEIGLNYNFDALIVTNTSDALRLVKLAKKFSLADQAEEVLFKAYFEEGKNVSNKATLISLGKQIGLKEQIIVDLLEGDEFLADIKEDIRHSEDDLDLDYIPFYLFNNKDVIQGSLSIDEYLSVLEKSYNDWKSNGESKEKGDRLSGQACSIDGVCSID
jgi:predicted DsbA family dithiol-disulfide isomerase